MTSVPVMHFTHIGQLSSIVQHGLWADTTIRTTGLVTAEAGDPAIKDRRRRTPVHVGPGGVVGDYVPFYFAPRSPMLYKITKKQVPSYPGSTQDLIYLVSTVEALCSCGSVVFTDRNAAKATAEHFVEQAFLAARIDFELMRAVMWNNTDDEPDRMERRMAECLVHRNVPWSNVQQIVVLDAKRKTAVEQILGSVGVAIPVSVRPGWYYS